MSTWLCIPSARPFDEAAKCIDAWINLGYRACLWKDTDYDRSEFAWRYGDRVVTIWGAYPGYARACNRLTRHALTMDPTCDWCVTGGDDTFPDPDHDPDEIAQQCWAHFHAAWTVRCNNAQKVIDEPHDSFGVMQPTGHRWGDKQGAYIDRVAGSPWIGREFAMRMNKGQGPYHPGFEHMFSDECLMAVAQQLGVFWQRPDLVHHHEHWALPDAKGNRPLASECPDHLKKWNLPQHWQESKALFERLRAEKFAECMPL